MSSFGDAQRVPAWKRLGLKLKPASEAQPHIPSATTTSSSVPNSRAAGPGGSTTTTPNAKRRASGGAPALDHGPVKRAKQEGNNLAPRKVKSVTFTSDTAEPEPSTPVRKPKQKHTPTPAKLAPVAAKPPKRSAPVNLEPALAYLRTWHTARSTWKFNKNHQTKLLEQVFAGADEATIPAADIDVFYSYISGLQGGVRARLRSLALGVRAEDMAQGAAAFATTPTTTEGKQKKKKEDEMAERKQREYEDVIRMFLNDQASRTAEKRRFNEVEYVLRTTDMEMQRRVVKRMRAETVLDELSETGDESTTSTTTTETETEAGDSASTETRNGTIANGGDHHRLQLNDGPQQRVKRKRKLRTAAVEDESSSSSESDLDSDSSSSSSSSSSSDSDSDEEDERAAGENEDTSSSSSSSSSSESESDSDDD